MAIDHRDYALVAMLQKCEFKDRERVVESALFEAISHRDDEGAIAFLKFYKAAIADSALRACLQRCADGCEIFVDAYKHEESLGLSQLCERIQTITIPIKLKEVFVSLPEGTTGRFLFPKLKTTILEDITVARKDPHFMIVFLLSLQQYGKESLDLYETVLRKNLEGEHKSVVLHCFHKVKKDTGAPVAIRNKLLRILTMNLVRLMDEEELTLMGDALPPRFQ